jgi:hypothetical protein
VATLRIRLGKRRSLRAALSVAAALALAACAAPPPVPGGPTSAIAACHAPPSAEKGGATLTFAWQLAAEEDRPEGSTLFFVSGTNDLLCQAFRSADGRFGNTSSGIGGLDPVSGSGLTYDTGTDSSTGETQIVVGRMPLKAVAVAITGADGVEQAATLGKGFYLAWLTTSQPVVSIVARDANGLELGRITDPAGLEPPLRAARSGSP